MRVIVHLAIAVVLAACSPLTKKTAVLAKVGGPEGEYCSVSETILASSKDTPGTLAQVRRENAKRRAMGCK